MQGEPQPKLEKLILIDDSNIDALHKQTSLLTTLAHSPYCNMIAVIIFSFEMLLIKSVICDTETSSPRKSVFYI